MFQTFWKRGAVGWNAGSTVELLNHYLYFKVMQIKHEGMSDLQGNYKCQKSIFSRFWKQKVPHQSADTVSSADLLLLCVLLCLHWVEKLSSLWKVCIVALSSYSDSRNMKSGSTLIISFKLNSTKPLSPDAVPFSIHPDTYSIWGRT